MYDVCAKQLLLMSGLAAVAAVKTRNRMMIVCEYTAKKHYL